MTPRTPSATERNATSRLRGMVHAPGKRGRRSRGNRRPGPTPGRFGVSLRQVDADDFLVVADIGFPVGVGRGTPDNLAAPGGAGLVQDLRAAQFLISLWC